MSHSSWIAVPVIQEYCLALVNDVDECIPHEWLNNLPELLENVRDNIFACSYTSGEELHRGLEMIVTRFIKTIKKDVYLGQGSSRSNEPLIRCSIKLRQEKPKLIGMENAQMVAELDADQRLGYLCAWISDCLEAPSIIPISSSDSIDSIVEMKKSADRDGRTEGGCAEFKEESTIITTENRVSEMLRADSSMEVAVTLLLFPFFSEDLTDEDVGRLVHHVRGFSNCVDFKFRSVFSEFPFGFNCLDEYPSGGKWFSHSRESLRRLIARAQSTASQLRSVVKSSIKIGLIPHQLDDDKRFSFITDDLFQSSEPFYNHQNPTGTNGTEDGAHSTRHTGSGLTFISGNLDPSYQTAFNV